MSQGFIYHTNALNWTACRAVLDALPGLSFAILQHENDIAFVEWSDFADAPIGHAFGQQLEARWRFIDGDYELLLVTENPGFTPPAVPGQWHQSTADVDQPQDIYLWGAHWQSLDGAAGTNLQGWVQAEVDAHLDYPVHNGGAANPLVVARATTYRQDGIPVLTRLLELQARAH